MVKAVFIFIVLGVLTAACDREDAGNRPLELLQAFVGNTGLDISGSITEGLPLDRSITLAFSAPVDEAAATNSIQLTTDQGTVGTSMSFSGDGRTVVVFPVGLLENNTLYTVVISGGLKGSKGESFSPTEISFKTSLPNLVIETVEIGGNEVGTGNRITDVPKDLAMTLYFSAPVNTELLEASVSLTGPKVSGLTFAWSDTDRTVHLTTVSPLQHLTKYEFSILEGLEGALGEPFAGFSKTLYSAADVTPKMPVVSDEELLTIVQQQTFKFFWDFAHPESGMARERLTSANLVTSGGSGFGIMALVVGIERNFLTRPEGLDRMDKILSFLETADRFHGAWPHWMDGNTGAVIPFSANDNGGDLVETSFLVQGLLTFRQYLDPNITAEKDLINRINELWESVEWDWYTRDGQNVLYWHWSPDKQWTMNHAIRGYNEALITYFLAAASPTHAIDASAYHEGWAGNGNIRNNKGFYGITLPLGYDYGGPLFFAHYSFLGLDPRGLSDTYGNYWTQNVNHSRINHAYSVANPKGYVGYSDENWGLTASDNHQGYSAHSPTNDLGVITPTAALSSFPYTPEESMKALKFFYYTLGDRLWGSYGFYDAFNLTEGWTANSYLAIDQGPIIVMIENHRTGLLWDLFMSAPEVQVGMDKLGFAR